APRDEREPCAGAPVIMPANRQSCRCPMLVDTHIHLYSKKFESDRSDVVARAREAGVGLLVVPGIDVATTGEAIDLARREDGILAMAALHPSETREASEEDFDEIRRLCLEPEIVAVGETGLDYYWERSFDDAQQAAFRRHIQLALELDLPLVLHRRHKKHREAVY